MTTLYRLFDADERLLYIGIADKWTSRMTQHAAEKAWWSDVASTRFESFPTRDEACAAEKAAIIAERPLHNVVHNNGKSCEPKTKREFVPEAGGWPLRKNQCVALGMDDGQCPVGMVVSADDEWVSLRLLNFWHGTFDKVRAYRVERILEAEWTGWTWTYENEWGQKGAERICKFDTDPLGEFQTKWYAEAREAFGKWSRQPAEATP